MRRRKRSGSCKGITAFALLAFCGAVMCITFFSVKILLIVVAVMLIALGIFLINL